MKLGVGFAAVAAAGMLAFAGQASATQWVATYTGHVNGGYDETGVFGSAGSYLDNRAFTAAFTYDTSLGATTTGADFQQQTGVFLSSASLTIGSGTYDFAVPFLVPGGQIETHSATPFGPAGPGYVFHSAATNFDFLGIFYSFDSLTLAGGAAAPNRLDETVAETAVVNPAGGPADYIGHFEINSGVIFLGYSRAFADLRPETYSVSAVGVVPEPASWGLMILGFGAIGAVLRRRRQGAAFA